METDYGVIKPEAHGKSITWLTTENEANDLSIQAIQASMGCKLQHTEHRDIQQSLEEPHTVPSERKHMLPESVGILFFVCRADS